MSDSVTFLHLVGIAKAAKCFAGLTPSVHRLFVEFCRSDPVCLLKNPLQSQRVVLNQIF